MNIAKVFAARDALEAHFVRGLLAREGIYAVILGENLQAVAGEVPVFAESVRPGVWVSGQDQAAAQKVIQQINDGTIRNELRERGPWRCPTCGERLEAQFTECWSCGASRPPAGHADEEQSGQVEPPATELWLDVPCTKCGYNLRGLSPTGRCPECGRSVTRTLVSLSNSLPPEQSPVADELLRGPLEAVAGPMDVPPDAAMFILECWIAALDRAAAPMDEAKLGTQSESDLAMSLAMSLCRAFCELIVEDMDSVVQAVRTLKSWHVMTCRQLGATLHVLIDRGLLEPMQGVDVQSFPTDAIESLFPREMLSDV